VFLFKIFTDPYYFFNVVVIVIVSITLHELGHALVALWQGDDTAARQGRISLDPRVHMSQTALVLLMLLGLTWGSTPVTESKLNKPWGPAIVSFAGPFSNLLMMLGSVWLVLGLQWFSSSIPVSMTSWFEAGTDFFGLAAVINAHLFLFNMLPIPPLDGFGILETFIPVVRRYSYSLHQYGYFILIVLFMFMGLGSHLFGLASLMVWKVSMLSRELLPAL
jgi:Zn-dependent protease